MRSSSHQRKRSDAVLTTVGIGFWIAAALVIALLGAAR